MVIIITHRLACSTNLPAVVLLLNEEYNRSFGELTLNFMLPPNKVV